MSRSVNVTYLTFWRDTEHWCVIASRNGMEAQSEVVALPPSEGGAGEEELREEGGQVEEHLQTITNDTMQSVGSGSGALAQSTLVHYRTPVLPNLAKAALERLQKRSTNGDIEDSPNSDFQPLKRRRVEEITQVEGDDNEGQTCSICFEPWSNSGNHRISSLKCGHLFGLNCIEKWIKGSGGGKCPQCNAPAKKTDIRVIYSKAISVVDTTDRDRALKDLEEEKRLRIGAQKAEAQAVVQYQLARTECDRLKEEIKQLRAQLESYDGSLAPVGSGGLASRGARLSQDTGEVMCERQGQYVLQKTMKISDSGSARVMAHDALQGMIVVSKPSSSSLVPAYGLAKLSTVDLRHSEYVGIHSGVIRDVCFSPHGDGMVLTASMDKSIRLTSLHANTIVQSFQVPVPAWACSWDQDDANYFCCGLQNGIIHFYDVRNTSCHVTELVRPWGGACPITSLSYIPLCRASSLSCAGLLAGGLDGCVFWEKKGDTATSYEPHGLQSLPGGACVCVSFEPYTRHCLASLRPSRRCPNSRHVLFQVHQSTASNQPFSSQLIHQFQGGSTYRLLSRSKLFQQPGSEDKILAAFGDEATKSVHLWDVSKTDKLQQLSMVSSAALDLVPFGHSNEYLAVLTENKMFTYNWQWA